MIVFCKLLGVFLLLMVIWCLCGRSFKVNLVGVCMYFGCDWLLMILLLVIWIGWSSCMWLLFISLCLCWRFCCCWYIVLLFWVWCWICLLLCWSVISRIVIIGFLIWWVVRVIIRSCWIGNWICVRLFLVKVCWFLMMILSVFIW